MVGPGLAEWSITAGSPRAKSVEIDHGLLRIGTTDPERIQPVLDALRRRGAVIKTVRLPFRPSLEDPVHAGGDGSGDRRGAGAWRGGNGLASRIAARREEGGAAMGQTMRGCWWTPTAS